MDKKKITIVYIDSADDVDIAKVTLKDLDVQSRTADSRVKGAGENRTVRYRTGITCKLGNVETSVWRDLAKAVAIRELGKEHLNSMLQAVRDKGTPAETKDEETILITALERCAAQA